MSGTLVFDTRPLRHFAAAQWVGVLRFLAGDRPIVVPDVVERELRDAVSDVADVGPSWAPNGWSSIGGTSPTTPETDYHLPFGKGSFRRHVLENGLIDYDEA